MGGGVVMIFYTYLNFLYILESIGVLMVRSGVEVETFNIFLKYCA